MQGRGGGIAADREPLKGPSTPLRAGFVGPAGGAGGGTRAACAPRHALVSPPRSPRRLSEASSLAAAGVRGGVNQHVQPAKLALPLSGVAWPCSASCRPSSSLYLGWIKALCWRKARTE